MYFRRTPFLPGIYCRTFRSMSFQSSWFIIICELSWFWHIHDYFYLYAKYLWYLLLRIDLAAFWTRNGITAGSCPILVMSCNQWMNDFMFLFSPVVWQICLLLTMIVKNYWKSSSNLVHVLSMHDSKLSSNTSVEIISAFVKPWNSSVSSTPNITNAYLTVWLASFGACVVIFYVFLLRVQFLTLDFIVKSIGYITHLDIPLFETGVVLPLRSKDQTQ